MGAITRLQRLAAYGVLLRADEILLTRISSRGFSAGAWTLPGGGVEHGEDVRTGLVREVYEETGLDIEVGDILDVHSTHIVDRSPAGRMEDFHGVHLLFSGRVLSADREPVVTEIGGTTDLAAWVPIHRALDELPTFDVVRAGLEAVGRRTRLAS
ncbi:MAG TPA: NUDIX domain-containing protein [Kribbellaceae bacterium]|nr:NUDIX domain-containing protein [Kribbellaceae bacterium]